MLAGLGALGLGPRRVLEPADGRDLHGHRRRGGAAPAVVEGDVERARAREGVVGVEGEHRRAARAGRGLDLEPRRRGGGRGHGVAVGVLDVQGELDGLALPDRHGRGGRVVPHRLLVGGGGLAGAAFGLLDLGAAGGKQEHGGEGEEGGSEHGPLAQQPAGQRQTRGISAACAGGQARRVAGAVKKRAPRATDGEGSHRSASLPARHAGEACRLPGRCAKSPAERPG